MPLGVYKRTREHRQNLSLSHIGQKQSEETKLQRANKLRGRRYPGRGLGIPHFKKRKNFARELALCSCGCGNFVKTQGAKYCSQHWSLTPEGRELHRRVNLGNEYVLGLESSKKGKTYEELYGIEKAKEIKCKLSKSNKGKVLSFEHREKISIGMTLALRKSIGEDKIKSIYPSTYNRYIRSLILERDRYLCQICGCGNPRQLQVHHIDYNKSNCKLGNLITICRSCHNKTRFNCDYWQNLLKKIVRGVRCPI